MKMIKQNDEVSRIRGSAMVEFAVILPVFVVLLFGFIQWGLIFGAGLTLRNATASSARYAVVNNLSAEVPGDPLDPNHIAVTNYVLNAVAPLLADSSRLAVHISVAGGGDIKQIDSSYNLPLILPFVVPGSSGGILAITARAIMQ